MQRLALAVLGQAVRDLTDPYEVRAALAFLGQPNEDLEMWCLAADVPYAVPVRGPIRRPSVQQLRQCWLQVLAVRAGT